MAKSVAVAIVQSRLDYLNSLFFGTFQHNIRKLQRIQNTLARIVVGHPLAASSSEFLYNLHWLPVHHRVNFKIALLTFKILTFNQPSYLASLVNFNIAPRTLRSSDQHLLYLPRTCTVTGDRAFNLAAPKKYGTLYQSPFAPLLLSPHSNSTSKLFTSLQLFLNLILPRWSSPRL
jgi:hypothetical protein